MSGRLVVRQGVLILANHYPHESLPFDLDCAAVNAYPRRACSRCGHDVAITAAGRECRHKHGSEWCS